MYVNPIEILGLSNATDTTSIDNEIVKKAKRKLFADIDLSDNGVLEYYGLQLTKGNCEKAIDELTNNDIKEFYLYLANNKPLNEFLASGKEAIFKNFKQDSIFKLPEFIKFISPYFAPKFDKALLSAFENDNADLTKAILNTSTLIAQTDLNSAFKSVSNNIQNKIAEIDEITKDIKNEESAYDEDDIEDVIQLVKEHFPTNTLNCLPQYFQSQILKIANSINYLSNSIWDAFDTTQVPNDLTEYLLTLNIGGLDRPTFENNFKIINKKNNERIEQAKNAPILKKYAISLLAIAGIRKQLEEKKIVPKVAFANANSLINLTEINQLGSFANEIRKQFALLFRSISICSWNDHKDIDTAVNFIEVAKNFTTDKETNSKIVADLAELVGIKRERAKHGTPIKSVPELGNFYGIGLQIYSDTHYFTIFHIPVLAIGRYSLVKEWNSYRFFGKLPLHKWQKILNIGVIALVAIWIISSVYNSNNSSYSNNDYNTTPTQEYTSPTQTNENSDNTSNNASEQIAPITSQYIGNQLKDGASPLTGCFGKGIYSGNATLTIKNGGNSDAIICLYSIDNDRTIRNEYVQKNSSFTMSNIAQGEYKIRVFYGNDWNPELENSCGTKGNFESDINFSEFDGTEYFEDSDRGYTNATITLYTVAGGNASSSSIDQSKFFSK
jgi:hypothetical protein